MATEAHDFRIDLADQLRIIRRTKEQTMTAFSKMSRDELNAYAQEHGIADPESYKNIPALIDALNETHTEDEAAPEPATTGSVNESDQPNTDEDAPVDQQTAPQRAFAPEPGLRVKTADGAYAEVIGAYEDGWRVRLDGSQEAVVLPASDLAAIEH